jgi:tetratricopeptide (TPR) repeat protein
MHRYYLNSLFSSACSFLHIRVGAVLTLFCLIPSLSHAQSFIQKGNELYQQSKFSKAITAYNQALAHDENPALVYFNLGNTYYQLDSVAKAIVAYQSAITEAPDFFRSYLNLGILYYNLDEMAAAAVTLETARSLDPQNVQIIMILASVYKSLREYGRAVVFLEQVLEKEPENDDCYFLLYDIYRTIGDLQTAKNWLDNYPQEGKRKNDITLLQGELAEEMGNLEEATYRYNQLVSANPGNKWAPYALVRVLEASGNTFSAIQHAESTLKKFPDFGELAVFAGNICFTHKLLFKAESLYNLAYKTGNTGGLVGLQNLLQLYKSQADEKSASHINDLILAKK